jgi:hypothetical protein
LPAWRDGVTFPLEVMLPTALTGQNGGNRRYVIAGAGQMAPAAIVAWMQGDPRYQGLFAG